VNASPHALGLAIPLVIAISTSLGARNGLQVKDRLALERVRDFLPLQHSEELGWRVAVRNAATLKWLQST
jgi:hypothetical protein